ncbi:MAG: sulfur carrier protein ThiS [Planctomycetaceae bacterium]|jgi:sulfur carrier protein|nr:sulfur carrier protein ThiS [Planctomycetaceae bacterium]
MKLTINDEPTEIPDGLTIQQLLERLELANRHVAVERNRHIVPYRTFANVRLEEGDSLELVTLVGGG